MQSLVQTFETVVHMSALQQLYGGSLHDVWSSGPPRLLTGHMSECGSEIVRMTQPASRQPT